MGGGSGSSSPPDYSRQNQSLASSENARRAAQAKQYNSTVGSLNNTASQLYNVGNAYLGSMPYWSYDQYLTNTNAQTAKNTSGAKSVVNGLNYSPTATQNISPTGVDAWTGQTGIWDTTEYSAGYQQLQNAFNTLNSWASNNTTPTFSPTIQGYDRTLSVDTPTVANYAGKDYQSQLSSLFNQGVAKAGEYEQKLTTDKANLNKTLTSWGDTYDQYASQVGKLNINNIDDSGADLLRQINRAKSGMNISDNGYYDFLVKNGLNYSFLNESVPQYTSELQGNYAGLLNQLGTLESQRAAEQSRVNTFKSSMGSQLDQLYSKAKSAGLSDYSKSYNDLSSTLQDYANQISGFDSTFEGWDKNSFNDSLSRVQNQLANYKNQYDTESARVKSYQDNVTSQLNSYGNSIYGLGIGDERAMNTYASYLKSLQQQMGGFSSSLGVDWTNQNNTMNQLNDQLTSLGAKRQQELARVDDFKQNFAKNILGLSNETDATGINSESALKALQDKYNTLYDQLGEFNSELNPNLGTLQNQLSREQGDIAALVNKRTSALTQLEQDIATMQQQAKSAELGLTNFDGNIDLTNYKDLNSISSLRQQITRMQQQATQWRQELTDLTGKASTMGYDATASLNKANTALGTLEGETGYASLLKELADLQTKRQGELDTYSKDLSGLQGDISTAPIENEDDLKTYLTSLSKKMSALSQYSGNDATALASGYNDAITSVNDKLTQLSDKRTALEKEAQTLLEQLNNTSYYNLGMVDSDKAAMDKLQATVKLYNAQQAMDELDAMAARLTGQRQRIETDAANAASAASTEAASATAANATTLTNPTTGLPLTEEEYLALLRKRQEQELYGYSSAFASALGTV